MIYFYGHPIERLDGLKRFYFIRRDLSYNGHYWIKEVDVKIDSADNMENIWKQTYTELVACK